MQRKKQSKSSKKMVKTVQAPRWKRVLWWAFGAVLIIGIIALVICRAMPDDDTPRLSANVTTPAAQTFIDNNTMFFATQHSIPEPNNTRDISTPAPVIISYDLVSGPYAPAFEMDVNNDDIAQNIKITPFIRGNWYLRGNSAIMFQPDAAWPADTKFTVKINKTLL